MNQHSVWICRWAGARQATTRHALTAVLLIVSTSGLLGCKSVATAFGGPYQPLTVEAASSIGQVAVSAMASGKNVAVAAVVPEIVEGNGDGSGSRSGVAPWMISVNSTRIGNADTALKPLAGRAADFPLAPQFLAALGVDRANAVLRIGAGNANSGMRLRFELAPTFALNAAQPLLVGRVRLYAPDGSEVMRDTLIVPGPESGSDAIFDNVSWWIVDDRYRVYLSVATRALATAFTQEHVTPPRRLRESELRDWLTAVRLDSPKRTGYIEYAKDALKYTPMPLCALRAGARVRHVLVRQSIGLVVLTECESDPATAINADGDSRFVTRTAWLAPLP